MGSVNLSNMRVRCQQINWRFLMKKCVCICFIAVTTLSLVIWRLSNEYLFVDSNTLHVTDIKLRYSSVNNIELENLYMSSLNQFESFMAFTDDKFKRLGNEIQPFDKKISKRTKHDRRDVKEFGHHILLEAIEKMQFESQNNWRRMELAKFTKLMQTRLYNLQHPSDCKKAKKLNCVTYDQMSGYGSQIHSIAYCLIIAYSKKRVVLPVFEKWNYSSNGWNEFLLPLTNCSIDDASNKDLSNAGNHDDLEILNVPFYNYMTSTLPPALPAEFFDILTTLHPHPDVFWISQFIQYILRYKPKVQKYIDDTKALYNFSSPIIGIHIRRTDKRSEAEFFGVDKYMEHVSTWFNMRQIRKEARRVYLATDDSAVITELVSKYPEYNFLFDEEATWRAQSNRYSSSSLMNIITSLHLFSHCDFVVCTHSSNVCRLIYEMMQIVKHADFFNNVISLDTIYFFLGQQNRQQIAIIEHRPETFESDEIELDVGDVLDVDLPQIKVNERKPYDGFTVGRNLRTNKFGKYPTYKVKEKWQIVEFAKYQ